MYGLGVNRLGVTNAPSGFSPLSLFANGEQGVWYDPSDLTTVFQQDGTTATIPWTSGDILDANRVGKLVDKSGNGKDALQTTLSKCPALKYVGGLYYLEFDGIDDGLQTASIDFSSSDAMSVFTGVRKEADETSVVAEISDNAGTNAGAFRFGSISGDKWRYSVRVDSTVNLNANSYTAPQTNVVTGLNDFSDPVTTIRVDGAEIATSANSPGTGNFGDHALNLGARGNGSSLHLDGRIYSVVVRNVLSNANDIALTEAYVATKTGVTI